MRGESEDYDRPNWAERGEGAINMSVWSALAGAGAGFVLGGPWGAALGGIAGHLALRRKQKPGECGPYDEIAFTAAFIGLCAKMAKADGVVTEDETEAFEDLFSVPDKEREKVRMIYNLAKEDVAGFEHYARQIYRMFACKPAVLEDILDGLFHIALADGKVLDSELAFLARVAELFGFSEAEFRRIKASHMGLAKDDPYAILGVEPDISDEDLRKAYHRMARENHPDALRARGVPEEFLKISEAKLVAVNLAHEEIQKQRRAAAVN